MLSIKLFLGVLSNIIWNWERKIETPIPANIPWIIAGEIALNHLPKENNPNVICKSPTINIIKKSF